jgi:pantoate--beta-alanine ligase
MKIFKTAQSLVEYLANEMLPLGMVPTMGALHKGHLSLIERALEENHNVLISIFINPTQFDDKTDLENYPIILDSDLKKMKQYKGNILVYIPKAKDIYGNSVTSRSFDLAGLDESMEGKKRRGHFQGVATVVSYFLKTFLPDNAYFGEKDFQQLRIIDHMTQSLGLKTKIVGCPIVRESDGLAMSSRNRLLSSKQRKLAVKPFELLKFAKSNAKKYTYQTLKNKVTTFFDEYDAMTLDYFKIVDPNTLKEIPLEQAVSNGRGFIAVHLGKIRLIDNLDMS